MEKKIATSLEVLIKVAQYESIRLTKYGEAKIEYDSPEERIEKEERLSDEVLLDMITTMKTLPEKLGKNTNAVVEIQEKIIKRIPEWLEKGPEPNIADTAKKSCEKSEAEAHAENERRKEKTEEKTDTTSTEIDELFSPEPEAEAEEAKPQNVEPEGEDGSEESANKAEEPKAEEETEKKAEDDFDDDEDLFA